MLPLSADRCIRYRSAEPVPSANERDFRFGFVADFLAFLVVIRSVLFLRSRHISTVSRRGIHSTFLLPLDMHSTLPVLLHGSPPLRERPRSLAAPSVLQFAAQKEADLPIEEGARLLRCHAIDD